MADCLKFEFWVNRKCSDGIHDNPDKYRTSFCIVIEAQMNQWIEVSVVHSLNRSTSTSDKLYYRQYPLSSDLQHSIPEFGRPKRRAVRLWPGRPPHGTEWSWQRWRAIWRMVAAGVAAGPLRSAVKRPAPPPPLHSPVPQWQPQPETRPGKGQAPPQARQQGRFMPSTHCVIRKIIKVS